uniref:RxLR effector protein n=1 Tax=Chromera velia CCMP2878 TaxID=1169474 RepID=A0A0G4GM35_9ALVE|eukprot:Cvel_4900.t1-p1 / transcript=Cvel_4900.t1 / gene=Cvel_4900 / organism=Chromera_velia_CCMP2878 / gene_product=hypothetical protein / transcript_product=hypothetical protein / location=Cvel_scaffold221:12782-15527(-) / protein_length=254 / sequence_SO=supercontig / SO=protein_coding / is_pseudo=false
MTRLCGVALLFIALIFSSVSASDALRGSESKSQERRLTPSQSTGVQQQLPASSSHQAAQPEKERKLKESTSKAPQALTEKKQEVEHQRQEKEKDADSDVMRAEQTAKALAAAAASSSSSLSSASATPAPESPTASPDAPVPEEMSKALDVEFNKIEPFGKEDTAKELQRHADSTQDTLVDAIENAEVAEIKRAVFRALTRLRAATIKEFDSIARLQTQMIDAYNDAHHFRGENPLTHLSSDEAPVETDKFKSFH